SKYRQLLCKNRIDAYDAYINANISVPALTILDAINFTGEAWSHVKASSIASCWLRTGILPPKPTNELDNFINFSENEDEVVQELIDRLALDNPYSANEYIDIDSGIGIEDILNDEEIISLVQGKEVIEDDYNQESFKPNITAIDAMESVDKLKSFIMQEEVYMDISPSFILAEEQDSTVTKEQPTPCNMRPGMMDGKNDYFATKMGDETDAEPRPDD
ncbi:18492_t:CDS:2, partial [Acaulospora morrowiae]